MNYREYLASIGRKGGKKSKRKLSKKDARQMAACRWERVKAARASQPTTLAAEERAIKEHNRAGI